MKNGSDNWLFLDSFMSLDQSQLFYLYLPSQESMNYKNKGKLYNYDVVCGGQKSKKPIQREIAPLPPRRPPKKEGKTRGLLIFCSYCFFLLAGSVTANQKKTALYPNFLCCLLPFPFIECILALVNTPTTSTEASLNSKKGKILRESKEVLSSCTFLSFAPFLAYSQP